MKTLSCYVCMYIVEEQQTEDINIECYDDDLHACKGINPEVV